MRKLLDMKDPDNKAGLDGVIGVYFLFSRKKILYIGYSSNLAARIRRHNSLIYSHFSFIKCKNADRATRLEANMIRKHRPRHNRMIPAPGQLACVGAPLGLSVAKAKSIVKKRFLQQKALRIQLRHMGQFV